MDIIEILKARFPECWFKKGSDFDGGTAAVWSGEDSWLNNETPAFDYWSESREYQFGVHIELAEFCQDLGYYWEAYDAGTYLLYSVGGESVAGELV